jgi:hypothetical protein
MTDANKTQLPAHMKKMLGWESPDDKQVPIKVGVWNAQKLGLWRSKVGWDIAVRQAEDIVQRCRHANKCPSKTIETEPCLPGCPDREIRMSALVILNAARQFAPVDAKRLASMPYYAPSREQFSEVLSELAATQAELEAVRGSVVTAPVAEGSRSKAKLKEKKK